MNLIDNIRILSSSFENAENTKIICEITPEELELHADENQIAQVLVNLVKNAVQANQNNPKAEVIISALINNKGHQEIRVTDNGPGIPEDLMDKIFVPFFTTKEHGSGIGLSLSRQIMQLHGGRLKIESVPGKTIAVLEF
jgi:signal transduction histidine kinase